jgi:hypothetical protein
MMNESNIMFSKIKAIESFFISKNVNIAQNNEEKIEEEKNINIYIKYLKNPGVIFQNNDLNNKNLILLFNEL